MITTITIMTIKEKVMKNTLKWVAIFLLLSSFILALYPTVSRLLTKKSCSKATTDFDSAVNYIQEGSFEEALDKGIIDEKGYLKKADYKLPVLFQEDIDRLYADSLDYNKILESEQVFTRSSDFELASLNLSSYGISNGMYGYLSADSIGLTLPIYLGATEYNMRYGTAHLNLTSLPIGGLGTNTVLAGHTGYTGKTFFDNIRYLTEGDKVVVKNYFGTINYRVRSMKNIDSTDLEDIYLKTNKDLLTLMTCSNGGTTRLIVICEREDND